MMFEEQDAIADLILEQTSLTEGDADVLAMLIVKRLKDKGYVIARKSDLKSSRLGMCGGW